MSAALKAHTGSLISSHASGNCSIKHAFNIKLVNSFVHKLQVKKLPFPCVELSMSILDLERGLDKLIDRCKRSCIGL
jgi:hypothetical protein